MKKRLLRLKLLTVLIIAICASTSFAAHAKRNTAASAKTHYIGGRPLKNRSVYSIPLPDALQTFSGYTSSGATSTSPDHFFSVTNSFGGNMSADPYGAFISDGNALTSDKTGYLQVSAEGGLGTFKLTAINIGEYDLSSSIPSSEFADIYVEGFLNGVSQGVSNTVQGINNYVESYAIALGGLVNKPIDSYKIYFTAKVGSNLTAFNLTTFTVGSSVASTAPTVTTTSPATLITSSSATLRGNISADGGASITDGGIVYSTSENPTTSDHKLSSGATGIGDISVSATGLLPGTLYHYRAYAINSVGTSYGADQTFTTASISPTLSYTAALTAFSTNAGNASTAQSFTASGGNLTANITITAPTGFEVSKVSATADFDSSVTLSQSSGTVASTTIYVRLTSSATGSPAGNITIASTGAATANIAVSGIVTAPTAPTVTNGAATDITANTVTLNGVVNDNGAETTAYFRLSANPANISGGGISPVTTIAAGSGSTAVSGSYTNLYPGNTYHYQLFAYNSVNGSTSPVSSTASHFTIPPAAPALKATTAVTSTGFTINWNAPIGAASYLLDIATDEDFSNILSSYNGLAVTSGTSQVVIGLNPNTTYYFRVRAINNGGTGVNSTTGTQATSAITPVITWANPSAISYGTALDGTQLNAAADVEGTFTYTPASGTSLTAGNGQSLSVTFTPSDGANYTTATKSVTIDVSKAVPVITWANPSAISYGTALDGTQLNATADVEGTFTYTPVLGAKPDAGNGQSLSVTFTPSDGANYTTATKSVTIDVSKAVPVITWANPSAISYGTALDGTQLNATADVEGTFTYTPVLGTKPDAGNGQSLSVTFTPSDAVNYTTATKSVTIDVSKAAPVITWANPSAISYGTALDGTQLNATADVEGTFTYTPASGTSLTAGNGQSLSVTFTPSDGANYTTATKSVTIDVSKAAPVITWANPSAITYGTALDGTQLNAAADVEGTFTYTPVLGTKPDAGNGQSLSVTFTPSDGANYTTATKSVTIDVSKAVPVITWANPSAISYGTALDGTQLNATADVEGTFTYTPVLGTKPDAGNGQSLSVTFTPSDGANYTTATKSVTIDVSKAVPVITWANPSAISYGTALDGTQLNATADVEGTFTYTPVLGTKPDAGNGQSLSVTFTPSDGANYTTATKSVTIDVSKAAPVITWANPSAISYGTALDGTQLNAAADVEGTFAYTPVLGTKPDAGNGQSLSVTFTPADAVNYTTATKSVTIDVSKAAPVITWANPSAISYGTALDGTQLNATADVEGTFTYTPVLGTKPDAGNGQSLSVTFTPSDGANYTTATKSVTIDVSKAVPVITWANPSAISYGTALDGTQLNAAADVEGTFAYTPVLGTKPDAGNGQSLSVTFTPSDGANYTTATKSVTIDVSKAVPVITWANPSAISYGTALDGTQLNATADVEGTFAYTPVLGTKPDAGNGQSLSVTFTPLDGANYTTATKSVTIDVSKAVPVITWANPSAISYGTALDGTQLNATADVEGTFAYTPVLGTKPDAGNGQSLSVTFTPSDGANYTTATKSVTIDVSKAAPVITWANPSAISYGTALDGTQLNAAADVEGTFTYTPVLGTKPDAGNGQSLSVTFTPSDAVNYTTATKSVTIDVSKAAPVITWANPSAISYGTALDGTQLNAAADVEGTFAYTPVLGTKPDAGNGQSLSVTFTPSDGANYTTATKSVTIDVSKAAPVITWANPSAISYGTALDGTQLNAAADVEGTFTYTPASGTSLTAGNGQSLSVTFTPADAVNYTTATKSVTIDVSKAAPVITWANPSAITYGTALDGTQLNAAADVEGTFAYTPVLGTKPDAGNGQSLSVTFTPSDAVNYTTATKSVTIDVSKAAPVITWANPSAISYGTALDGTQLNAAADVEGTFAYTPVLGTKPDAGNGQSLSVTFTPSDGANYTTATKSVTIDVSKAVPVITWANPSAISYGTALDGTQLNATADVEGTFAYTPVLGTKPDAGNGQSLSVTFTPSDGANYTTATKSVTIDVSKAAPVITWANPSAITYGTALDGTQLNATADVEGTFTYTPVLGTKPDAGNGQSLSVTFTPADAVNYTTATKSVTIDVSKAAPVITWANPSAISYGTALDGTQLNATADVEGTFTYTPVLGTKPDAGNGQSLSVTFTPADGANYTTATKSVTIDVSRAVAIIISNDTQAFTYDGTPKSIIATLNHGETTLTYTPQQSYINTGEYPVTITAAATANYLAASKTVTLKINPADIRGVSFADATYTYDGKAHSLAVSGLPAGATAIYTNNSKTNAGNYTVTTVVKQAGYSDLILNAQLSINPAVLTIKANNQSRNYGAINPALTLSYSGFVNGEDQSSLSSPATATTVATATTSPGNYAIKANSATSANYNINYVNGTLTIIPLTNAGLINLTLSSGTLSPDFAAGTFAYTAQEQFDVSSITLTPNFDPTATTTINGTLVPNGSPSYSIPMNAGNNTITTVVTAQDGVTKNTYTLTVYRAIPPDAVVPTNILSPNGDGKNDAWVIKDIQLYPNNRVTIYDKAGRVIYSKRGYNNEWDGTLKGAPLAQGTYYYIVDLGASVQPIKGFITILKSH